MTSPRVALRALGGLAIVLLLGLHMRAGEPAALVPFTPPAGLTYTNERVADVPWSVHVVRWSRTNAQLTLHSSHATRTALGLTTLGEQIATSPGALGLPVAAVNGDFYQRDQLYAGDPRGLQIVEGELLSAPSGGACFWLDATNQPHTALVQSLFHVVWPDGTTNAFGLNEDRKPDALVLYSPAAGPSTRTRGGREFILESTGPTGGLVLRSGQTNETRVREIRDAGDSPLPADALVLSAGPKLAGRLPAIGKGTIVKLVCATLPDLTGASTAIGGGPLLVRNGRAQKIELPATESYQFSSMLERHPRTAIGWNRREFLFVLVDGRQKELSVGMTLKELAAYLVKLGCEEAMNLDGGGSATLWCGGAVRNRPCDGRERPIANALILTARPVPAAGSHP